MKILNYIFIFFLFTLLSLSAYAHSENENDGTDTETVLKTVKVYPNPFISTLNLEFDWVNDETTTVQIFNIIGKQIYVERFEPGVVQIKIDTDAFEKGIYFVKINNGYNVDTQRIIKR